MMADLARSVRDLCSAVMKNKETHLIRGTAAERSPFHHNTCKICPSTTNAPRFLHSQDVYLVLPSQSKAYYTK
jgi:hypothetical protein